MKEYVNRKDVQEEGILEAVLNYKPVTAIGFVLLIGVFLIYLRTTVSIVLGIIFIAIAAVGLFFIKDRPVVEFYNDAAILYSDNDPEMVRVLPYEEIKSWAVDGNEKKIFFILNDEEIIQQDTVRYTKAYSILNKLIPEKRAKSKFEERRSRK